MILGSGTCWIASIQLSVCASLTHIHTNTVIRCVFCVFIWHSLAWQQFVVAVGRWICEERKNMDQQRESIKFNFRQNFNIRNHEHTNTQTHNALAYTTDTTQGKRHIFNPLDIGFLCRPIRVVHSIVSDSNLSASIKVKKHSHVYLRSASSASNTFPSLFLLPKHIHKGWHLMPTMVWQRKVIDFLSCSLASVARSFIKCEDIENNVHGDSD